MIKYSLILSLVLLFGASQVYAQFSNHVDGHVDPLVGNLEAYLQRVESVEYSGGIDPIGAATAKDYYNQEWEAIAITFDTKKNTQKYDKARYNLNLKVLEVQAENRVYFVSTKKINKFVFTPSNDTFIAKKDEPKLGLLELVAEYKNVSFVTAYAIKTVGEVQAYGGKPRPVKTATSYLFKPNESLFRLSNSKKKNAKFFGKNWGEVSKFMKQEKLSFKKKEDIIKILDFYTKLIS